LDVQRRLADLEYARDVFKGTNDFFFQVDCLYRKFRGDSDDYYSKLRILENSIYFSEAFPHCAFVDVDVRSIVALDRLPALKVSFLLNDQPTNEKCASSRYL
jgi:hypothetical protein